MKTLFQIIFPPQFEPFQPYLSLPYIKGLLKIYGIESKCFDANIDFYWWFLKEWKQRGLPRSAQEEYLLANVEDAIRVLKTVPQHLWKYRWAVNVVDEYLSAVSPQGLKISLTSLTIGNKYSSEDLRPYLQGPDNIFRNYFNGMRSALLGSPDTKYYLISLVVLDQLGAAATFAQEIKRERPEAIIVIGGPMVSRLYKRLIDMTWLREFVDIIAPDEAYKVLPKIIGLEKSWTGHVTPDFSDLDLDRYLSPQLVLPYLVAHGCKWGQCTFCSHHLTYSEYRASTIHDVVRDLSNLQEQYGVEYISFSDEHLTIDQLSKIASLLQKKKTKIKWSSFVRAEPKFADKNFTEKLYESGARLLMFGFESASQRVLKLMRKGTDVNFYVPILESCKEANIAVRLDFMVGFPTEIEEEAQRTFAFIQNNTEVLDTPFSSYAVACFELRKDVPIMRDLKKYGVKATATALLRGDLDEQYDFLEDGGPSAALKHRWRHKMIAYFKNELSAELIVPQNKTHQLCFKDLFDRGCFGLPVTKIESSGLQDLYGAWNHGIVAKQKDMGSFIIKNYATGGVLELSVELICLVKALNNSSSLYSVYLSYKDWSLSDFVKVINFLYRNDYLVVWNKCSTPEIREDIKVKLAF
ncbi:radical SAM protein [Candidatus Babeliales bacterium]|nr:radical SAM protein [Candidatus Babeliales bacterium]